MHRFETSYRRHLAVEQRRAVLHALRAKLDPDVTMGDVLDAANALGFGEELGGLSLQDLADALLTPAEPAANSGGDQPPERLRTVDRLPEDDGPPEKKVAAKRKSAGTKPVAVKPVSVKPAPPPPKAKSKPTRVKASGARLRALKKKIAADERMNLDEAAELFVPLIDEMDQATMQDLEDFTGVGRRKLRFHIGQLVREGHIERHGMGRGTFYTTTQE